MCSLMRYFALLSLAFLVLQVKSADESSEVINEENPELSFENAENEEAAMAKDEESEEPNADNNEEDIENIPEEEVADEESLPEGTVDGNMVTYQKRSCLCKDRVNQALVKALQSCTDVLDAIQRCKKPSSSKPSKTSRITSCKCSDKVTAALVKSLKSCNDAIGTSAGCGTNGGGGGGGSVKASSCAELLRKKPGSTSGYYMLYVNGKMQRFYCYMAPINGIRGWTRLGKLGRTGRCPRTLTRLVTGGVRHCARPVARSGTCASVKLPSRGLRYSRVTGKVFGFQYYTTDGARGFHHGKKNINRSYMDGVSITQGSPRKHVWTFVSALTATGRADCPCIRGADAGARLPPYVGNNYFCESGFRRGYPARWAITDPLWDGKGCYNQEASCCRKSGLPWFNRYVGPSTKYLELRVCCDESTSNENVSVREYEIYVR